MYKRQVWEVTPQGQYMKVALKEHKGAVSCIKIKSNDEEVKRAGGRWSCLRGVCVLLHVVSHIQCVTASSDGTCIIWDLT